jgi:oxygen-independent coproporphyrinogen-3 oxidase
VTGLYVHVPFCEARCSYCAFVTWADRHEQQADYFAALAVEAARRCEGLVLDTIYFGGGTPSLPAPGLLASVLRRVRDVATIARDAEITLEANPESVDRARAEAWRAAGFNRVSVGVQSFDARVLEAAGRLHGPDGPARAFGALRSAGFENLSLDLIAGLPHETRESLGDSRRRALELAPQHVSLYLLELDEAGKHSPLAASVRAGRASVVDDDELADWYEESREELESAGLRCYEISNFAREGRESRHNLGYWTCEPFAAAGVAAHWFDGARRRFNLAGFEAWQRAVASGADGEAPESLDASPADLPQERLMLGLRLSRGVDLAALEDLHPGARERFGALLEQAAQDGLIAREAERVRLTVRGALLSNELFSEIVAL